MTACGLVTEQDASAALGRAASHGTAGGTAALSECIYDNGSLIVSMKTDSKALYDTSHTQAHAKGAADVPSVGDSAFQYSAGTAFSGVEFLRGTTSSPSSPAELGRETRPSPPPRSPPRSCSNTAAAAPAGRAPLRVSRVGPVNS